MNTTTIENHTVSSKPDATIFNIAAPAGRVLLALMFLMAGLNKIGQYQGTQAYMESAGVPGLILPIVIAVEVIGALMLIVGFKTRIAALALFGFTLVANVLFHANFADQMQMLMFMKNTSVMGGLLMVFALGAGAYSLDNRNKQ
ncbi:DoxX family protein [Thalassotalea sp. PS06]|uniref:DoxX family protein n=1 Tax=Thalassotalea sp. PS06 TaxID=2594005 RepID=UPI001162423A|nr:DoxX family protein [Thalassotalea sp. PS06]QDP01598.1 DoxX family protein [Thalassotalea sp. PS06]